jgi:glycosyltransferase involved in cell wall biosynthesis
MLCIERKPVLTIFYQFDPWRSTIGGIQTLITSFVKYAPSELELRLVGITSDRRIAVGQWHKRHLEGKEIWFLPLFYLANDNARHLIPTTIKYLGALLKANLSQLNLASDFIHFHRLEPTLASRNWLGHKTFFIHNDITHQLDKSTGTNVMLWRRFPALYTMLEQYLVKQFNQVLSCNANSLAYYQTQYPDLADRFQYVHNSVDTETFYPWNDAERDQHRRFYAQRLNLSENTRFALFAGRLHPQKDPVLLVRSFAKLTEPDTHLLIVGDGELAPQVKLEIERLGQTRRISMLGALPRAEVADLHRLSSVCILTSEFEGLPLVALEALACGTPIITTRTGDTPRFLTPRSGLVCEQRTPEQVAQALAQVLQYPTQFPAFECLQVAQPFAAATVIGKIYSELLVSWHAQPPLAPVELLSSISS